MNKSLTIIIILGILYLAILPVQAKDISTLKVNISQDIAKDCTVGYHVQGCYFEGTKQIYIANDLDAYQFKMVFWHEIFHFLGNGKDMSLFNNNEELAADIFAYAMMIEPSFSAVNREMADYFKKIIME